MKRLSSILMLAMVMVAALSFTSCGGSDDDEIGGSSQGGGSDLSSQQTLTIDGQKFYYNDMGCTVDQTKSMGMYLSVVAFEQKDVPTLQGKILTMHISPNKVADLKVGDSFGVNKLSIQEYRNLTEIPLSTYRWKVVAGRVDISKITSMEMTIQIHDLKMRHKDTNVEHTISGIAVLNSGVYDSKNNLLSFEDAIK